MMWFRKEGLDAEIKGDNLVKTARPSFSLCLCTYNWGFKSIVTKPTIVLTIDMHYLSDNIVLSPLHSVKDVTYGYTP